MRCGTNGSNAGSVEPGYFKTADDLKAGLAAVPKHIFACVPPGVHPVPAPTPPGRCDNKPRPCPPNRHGRTYCPNVHGTDQCASPVRQRPCRFGSRVSLRRGCVPPAIAVSTMPHAAPSATPQAAAVRHRAVGGDGRAATQRHRQSRAERLHPIHVGEPKRRGGRQRPGDAVFQHVHVRAVSALRVRRACR